MGGLNIYLNGHLRLAIAHKMHGLALNVKGSWPMIQAPWKDINEPQQECGAPKMAEARDWTALTACSAKPELALQG